MPVFPTVSRAGPSAERLFPNRSHPFTVRRLVIHDNSPSRRSATPSIQSGYRGSAKTVVAGLQVDGGQPRRASARLACNGSDAGDTCAGSSKPWGDPGVSNCPCGEKWSQPGHCDHAQPFDHLAPIGVRGCALADHKRCARRQERCRLLQSATHRRQRRGRRTR